MGTKGKEIIGTDLNTLINDLNKALADEWLAYYQYWIGSKLVKGPMSKAVMAELVEHATEELEHADMLTNRILQLDGTPILKPEDWYKMTNCGYAEPKDFHVKAILKQNIDGERCAIEVYKKLLDTLKDKDTITYHIF
jgi:bacterioferritin